MSDETILVQIQRDGCPVGTWDIEHVARLLGVGVIRHTDHFRVDGMNGPRPVIPPVPFPGEFPPADFETGAFYYVQGKRLYGPRSAEEIGALLKSGHLIPSDIVTMPCMEEWKPISELVSELADAGSDQAGGLSWGDVGIWALRGATTGLIFGPVAAFLEGARNLVEDQREKRPKQ